MIYPVIGAYELGDKVRIEIDGVLREGEIICIGLNGYVVASDACVYIVNDPQIKWCARTSGKSVTEEKVICYNSDTALGLATLNKAFELQKKYTELEGDIRRLCDWVMGLKNNENPIICARFSNPHLKCICDAICDFRPLTEEERKQQEAELKEFIDKTLKKQSE